MISSDADTTTTSKQLHLLKRIRDLKEIVDNSAPTLSQDIPVGYTPARWNLALQSFDSRLQHLKACGLFPDNTGNNISGDVVEFGPEWELKCAQRDLEELLNS